MQSCPTDIPPSWSEAKALRDRSVFQVDGGPWDCTKLSSKVRTHESMAALGEAQIAQVLRAYRQRVRSWATTPLALPPPFQKSRNAAGASLLHVHLQLVALPMIPPALAHEIDGAKAFHESRGGCVYCEMIAREISARARVVSADEGYVALCPYASRTPYETWILPRRHGARFETANRDDDTGLARLLRETLTRIDAAVKGSLLNFVIHSGPPHMGTIPSIIGI